MRYHDWLQQHNLPHDAWTYEKWSREETAAGRPPEKCDDHDPEKTIVTEIRAIADQLGYTPSIADLRHHGLSPGVVRRVFATHNAAIRAAGLKPNKSGRGPTRRDPAPPPAVQLVPYEDREPQEPRIRHRRHPTSTARRIA